MARKVWCSIVLLCVIGAAAGYGALSGRQPQPRVFVGNAVVELAASGMQSINDATGELCATDLNTTNNSCVDSGYSTQSVNMTVSVGDTVQYKASASGDPFCGAFLLSSGSYGEDAALESAGQDTRIVTAAFTEVNITAVPNMGCF